MAMKSTKIEYPEAVAAALNLSPEAFTREAKLVLSVKLFELCRLTSGQAAKLAGVPCTQFLLECHRFGAASVHWDEEELATEFGEFEN